MPSGWLELPQCKSASLWEWVTENWVGAPHSRKWVLHVSRRTRRRLTSHFLPGAPPLPQNACCGLNVCVSPKHTKPYTLRLGPQHSGVRRWGLGQMDRVSAFVKRLMDLDLFLTRQSEGTTREKAGVCLTPDLNLGLLRSLRSTYPLFRSSPTMTFGDSSLNGPRQPQWMKTGAGRREWL